MGKRSAKSVIILIGRFVALWLLIGVAANVLVTWTIAGVNPARCGAMSDHHIRPWPMPVPAHWPRAVWHGQGGDGGFWYYEYFMTDGSFPDRELRFYQTGFPNRSMAYGELVEHWTPDSPYPPVPVTTGGIALRFSDWRYNRVLPLHPLWPGFITNSLFYASVCCSLYLAATRIRRRFNKPGPTCGSCGYDLRGLPAHATVCPECGKPITPPAPRATDRRNENAIQ